MKAHHSHSEGQTADVAPLAASTGASIGGHSRLALGRQDVVVALPATEADVIVALLSFPVADVIRRAAPDPEADVIVAHPGRGWQT